MHVSVALCAVYAMLAGKLATAIRENLITLATLESRLQCLVLDEADLLLSYGYDEDLALIAPAVGATYMQALHMYRIQQHLSQTAGTHA